MPRVHSDCIQGNVEYNDEDGYTIGGFRVDDLMESYLKHHVSLEIMGRDPEQLAPEPPTELPDAFKKLLGD